MPILITGSSGFLSKYLIKILGEQNIIETLSRHNSKFNIDLSKDVPTFISKYDIVIHAAGKAHSIPRNELERNDFHNTNVIGSQNLLKGLEKCLPKNFVFISSVSVYGLYKGININESSPLLAKDPYGLSKIQAEKLIIEWCKENNVICTILRLPLLAGANPPGNLGGMIKGLKKGYYFNITGVRAQKSMVLASDVGQCIIKVSEIGGIYNLTDGYHPTFNELSGSISLQIGRKFVPSMPLFFAKILAKFGDLIGDSFPINSTKLAKIIEPLTFDDTKARNAFGWNPSSVLKEFKLKDNA
jgi:nucleoside-diphosphate-sugar epimerase